jgi:hypothetical protein
MSEREDFLARWSRRKRQAGAQVEGAPAASSGENVPERAANADKVPGTKKPLTDLGEPPFDPKIFDPATLPPIESITAETDIRSFLAPGVPADLTRAALRRAWAADPQIRDFVGLADYAWDFHAPDAMAGFGPLEMTDELRRDVIGMLTRGQPAEAAADNSAVPPQQKTEQPPQRVSLDEAIEPAECQSPPETVGKDRDEAPDHAYPTLPSKEDIALQNRSPRQTASQSIVRRGHGRALPKS